MDEILIESAGNIEVYTDIDNVQEEAADNSYVYVPVPEEVEDYKNEEHTKIDNTENAKTEKEEIKEEVPEEVPEEKEEEKEDVEQSVKNDVVSINNVKRDILDNDGVVISSNTVQNIIDTPLNEYSLTDSLHVFTIVLVIGVLFYLLVKRTVFKWN